MPTVVLHIGAVKTGTTYLQHMLFGNRALLAERGVLLPGAGWVDQVAAAEEVVGVAPTGKPPTPGAWTRLVAEALAHDGPTAVISMEVLSFASEATARRIVNDFRGHRVRVVLTTRDLARVVPAQWQELTKNGDTISLERYCARLAAPGSRARSLQRSPWRALDHPAMVRTWQPLVGRADMVVVTVPPPSADRMLLWQRFSEALEIDGSGAAPATRVNESLGMVSAELMRRLNRLAAERDEPYPTWAVLKHRLAEGPLAARKAAEPAVVLPAVAHAWAARESQVLADELRALRPIVVGDLDELVSTDAPAGRALLRRRPAQVSDADLVAAALDGLLGVSAQAGDLTQRNRRLRARLRRARRRRRRSGRGRGPQQVS